MIGKIILHYRILEKLGSGGMGVVYKAEDTKLQRTVAVKFLSQDLTRDEEAKKRFMHEAQAASALDHPNIGTIYEVGQTDDGQMFIVMAYYDGETLKGKIERGPQPIDEAIGIALQIGQGLAKAHGKEIVHRDIKPANIMITSDKVVKIVDFGLAKLAGRTKLTKDDSTLGTVAYMSPEQAQGAEVDHRSDIFALGIVLYEMLTGQMPFKGDYEQAVVYSTLHEEPEPITGLRTGVPMELERIVSKCLAKEPSDRYQQVNELIVDLRRMKKEKQLKETLTRAGVTAKIPKRRVRSFVRVVAIIGVLILAVVGYFFFAPSETDVITQRKMLAVLPFENLGPPDQEYFADGITEEIMSRLATIRALGVISRTSTSQYKQTDKTLQQIGEELGVEYILEGTVRWEPIPDGPSRVRVTPQLIRVSDDTYLWSDRYNAVLADIFQVQSDIALQVSEALNLALLKSERRSLAVKPTDNLEAYDAYLRGMDYYNRSQEIWSEEELRIALQMYQKAIELDSTFALAYARLALAHVWMVRLSFDRTEERLAKIKKTVDKALQLDSDLPDAHLALGFYYSTEHLQYDRAQKEFAIALEHQPNNSEVLWAIGRTQWNQGRFQEALVNLKRASELNPRTGSLACHVGGTYFALHNYPEADRFHDRAVSLTPDRACPYYCKAWIYLNWDGDTKKARVVLEEASQKVGLEGSPPILFPWVILDVFDGNYQEALDRLSSGSSEAFEWQDYYYIPKAQLYAQIYGLMNRPQLEQVYYDSARIFLEAKLRERPEDTRFHSSLGIAYAGLGRKEEAIREGKLAVELLPVSRDAMSGPTRVENLARIYVMVGEYDAAIDQLEFLLSIPRMDLYPLLQLDPGWAPLRDHPRFQKLLERG